MNCEKCNENKATISYTENKNGSIEKHSYCEKCALEMKEIQNKIYFNNIFDIFSNFFADFNDYSSSNHIEKSPTADRANICSNCGVSFADIVKKGRVGCAFCYEHFYDELIPSIARIHGQSEHIGKVSTNATIDTKKKKRILEYTKKLDEAVFEENYEDAAKLRDEIKELEEGSQIE